MNIKELYETVQALRLKCPWDREQTHETLIPHLIEESYEVIDAVESKCDTNLKEELGDLLLQVVLNSVIAQERNAFSLQEVIDDLNEKMIFRHPHVFGDAQATTGEEALANWETSKQKEKQRDSILDGIPKGLPGLQKAQKIQNKAAKHGFDWQNINQVTDKLEEEVSEFKEAVSAAEESQIEEELGDLFFTLVNLSRFLKIDSETCLRQANNKFEKRFRYIEKELKKQNKTPTTSTLDEMELLWNQAKIEC